MKTLKFYFIVFSFLSGISSFAQVKVDHPIQLTGSGTDAKVTGIQSVTNTQDAASAGSVQNGGLIYAADGGTANAYAVTLAPGVTAYTAGMVVNFKAANTNTGASTLTVNGLTPAQNINKLVNTALASGDIAAGQMVSVIYDGANFQMLSQLGNAAVFLPTVISTTTVTAITDNNAESGGAVSSNGGAAVTAYGVCWGTSPNPILGAGNYSTDGTGTGVFTSTITGLTGQAVTYYVRAYATNSVGTAYGPQITFAPGVPIVASTIAATAITSSGAASGGNVSSDGGALVTAYGVCWSTSATPVLGVGNYTSDGSGTGTFSSTITGLAGGTTYYVRAYATNGIGTAYGPQITFTTGLGIGSTYGGGIIAYILQPGDAGYDANVTHGLIAATSDQSTSATWYNGTYESTGASGQAIGTGASNTAAIIATQGAGTYAASICTAYNGGGYTDWYLPSWDELNQLYNNRAAIGGFAANGDYWSSFEFNANYAYSQVFNNGAQGNYVKNFALYVRAVRSF